MERLFCFLNSSIFKEGMDLLKTYQPTDVFLEEWEENEDYCGECDRVIRTLS